ncbi:MAG: beta-phosphoglucomutase [Pseudoxanthomonas sp.]
MRQVDARGADDPWQLRQDAFDPLRRARDETLFALANGCLGVRGGFEEDPGPSDGSYLAAAFEQTEIHYHERLAGFARSTDTRKPVAEGTRIRVWLGEECVDLGQAQWLAFERVLDLRRGHLQRRLRLRTPGGREIEIHAERVVPFTEQAVLAIRYSVRSIDYSGPLTLVSALEAGQRAVAQGEDPRIGAGSGEGLLTVAAAAEGELAWLEQRAPLRGFSLVCGQQHRSGEGGLQAAPALAQGERVEQRFTASLRPGQQVTLEKFVAYQCEGEGPARVAALANTLQRVCVQGFAALAQAQAGALEEFWKRAELWVEGDARAEQALRFNLFHLLQSAGRNGVDGTAAKGLTGEGYEGHCFWDTEAFVLPVMVFTAPEVARAMLMYRFHTLDAARAHARELNHPLGALYAWRTIAGGECSAHYPSGSAAYHINAAVAYAIGLYLDASDDLGFLAEAGAEMLFETARIWPQVGHFNPRHGGAFCIHEVTGPDEYTTLVDDNFYTNRMAQRHLQRAAAAWQRLQAERPALLAALAERLALSADEVDLWRRAAAAMHLPYDERAGVYAQDGGFLDKPRWPHPLPKGERRPLLLDYHPLTLYRHQICKQADVAMALVLAGDGLDLHRKRRSFDYYEAVTTHDSTLSAPVFGILASEVGQCERAWRYFDASLRVDLDDRHGNTDHGVHMAALAGSWRGVVEGFAGLRVAAGRLEFAPVLPAAWRGYGFGLRWRGRTLHVRVDGDGVRYRLEEGAELEIVHAGAPLRVAAGRTRALPLANPADAARASFPRPARALLFDLDGVLTDTARTHYRSWQRLADEIGVPFDRQVNERLKGVDRMASLDIVLERAGREFDAAERAALAERKNGYYLQAIEALGPQDLFPGAERLLRQARAAGLKLGLASASRNAPRLLQRLGIAAHFDYIADPARLARAKPDPAIFLDAAAGLGVPPALCIGVEDAAAGIEAIHAAGMAAIGIGQVTALPMADAVLPDIAALRLEDFIAD